MKQTLCFAVTAAVVMTLVIPPGTALAGENRGVRLAMHCVASDDYLNFDYESPERCDDIDCDLTPTELASSSGWGTIFLVAYEVTGLSCVEFGMQIPTGGGASFDRPEFYREGLTLGDPMSSGGIVCWGNDYCLEPESSDGGVIFGYIPVHFDYGEPIVLKYIPSAYSYVSDPHNYTIDCSDDFEEDPVTHRHGCVIGGEGEAIIGDPCTSGPQSDDATWGEVKQLYRR